MSTNQRIGENSFPMTDLFMRIQLEHQHREQCKRRAHFKHTFIYLLIVIGIMYLFEYHIRVYNILTGPFHVNFNQLIMSLDEHFVSSHKDLQVELDQTEIEQKIEYILNRSSYDLLERRLPYILIKIKNNLYVKLATINDTHYYSQLLYHFQLFTERTLTCILQQFNVSLEKYTSHAIDRSMFISLIEELYRQNTTEFNMKLITKCGILLGYLSRPRNESMYTINSKETIQFDKSDMILDVSTPYYSYEIFLFSSILFSYFFIKAFIYLLIYVFHAIYRSDLLIHSSVKNHLNTLRLDCLKQLDDLLLRTANENNYHNRLFLLQDKYLLISYIDWNEQDTSTLHRFYNRDPLTVIPVETIICIENNEILSKHDDQHTWYSLPTIHSISKTRTVEWVHQKLMQISITYQECYADLECVEKQRYPQQDKEEKQRRQQKKEQNRLRRKRKIELKRQLNSFIAEEEENQRIFSENNQEMIFQDIVPASPQFIAQFRLMNSEQINHHLSDTLCAICHENIEYDESYAQWPCQAKHIYHYDCMLMVLRAHYTCPLCRHPVEKSDFIIRLAMQEYLYNIFFLS